MPSEVQNVEAIDMADGGRAVIRHNGKVIFVKGLVPGDIADVEILKSKKRHSEGRLIKIIKPSPQRVEPQCIHFGSCGGCSWQNLDYETQVLLKQKQVEETLKRIGGIAIEKCLPILRSKNIYRYRNKLEFTFSNKRWLPKQEMNESNFNQPGLGFHIPGLFDKVIDIKECHLQAEPSNIIRLAIREFAIKEKMLFFDIRSQQGLLRNLIIRTTATGELMVAVVFFYDDKEMREKLMSFIANKFPQINALLYIINPKKNDSINDLTAEIFKGNPYITEELNRRDGTVLRFRISAQSFFQTNTAQANALYNTVCRLAGFNGDEIVYDLYTGCGSIACFIASEVKQVTGIEYVEQAVIDAKLNAELNHINNVNFHSGDIKDMLNEEFFHQHGIPDVIITDPPRNGMHPDVIKTLMGRDMACLASPEKIIYVSCNPATQARDMGLMAERYFVKIIQPVDMFPHTSHVENVALMVRK